MAIKHLGLWMGTLSLVVACSDDSTTSNTMGSTGTSDESTTMVATSSPTTTTPTTTMTPTSTGDPTTDTGTGEPTSTTDQTTGAPPVCGDGNIDPGEDCDDANQDDTDACTNACTNAACGDGFVQVGVEECDDANQDDADACTNACKNAACGDGVVGPGEMCDDGNQDDADACTNICAPASCGDSIVQIGVEECDDGNMEDTDDCLNTCKSATCGDMVIQQGVEECDDGNGDDTDACPGSCLNAFCGDNFVQAGVEECDDANQDDTDACVGTCVAAVCGDGLVQAGVEECDDANMIDTDACVGTCAAAACGDGFVQAGVEACDDGNMVDNDLCSNTCTKNPIPLGTIMLGGSSFSNIQTALNTIGEPFMVNNTQWLQPNAANILIMSNDGGNAAGPDYQAHLNSGKHILMFGGSGLAEYRTYWTTYFSIAPGNNWHQSSDCVQDWSKTMAHPLVAGLPMTYEFPSQSASFHMMHFNEVGQPMNTTLIGRTCHQAPNNYVLAMRRYANGGTLTYMLLDLGPYANGDMQPQFVVPFIQSYFDWLQAGAP
mgnify:CR=1 FL=1